MAVTRSIASSNLINAVQKRDPEQQHLEKKMMTRGSLQRSALGNISNQGVLTSKADAALKGLKAEVYLRKTAVAEKTEQPILIKEEQSLKVKEEEVASRMREEPIEEIVEILDSDESISVHSQSSHSMDVSGNSEAEIAFSRHMLNMRIKDIDSEDSENPQLVSEYVNDIYKYMTTLEKQLFVRKNFLANQKEINGRMRAILVDWLVQVHQRFHLLQETLFLAVGILDRYLQIENVPKARLQLVGVSSMWIAAKYEEMYAPEVADFSYITDNAYTKAEIRQMECNILRALDFMLGRPLPIHFLRRFSKAGDVDATTHNLAKYFMELTLVPYETAHLNPSYLAAGALNLAMKVLGDAQWNQTVEHYSGYEENSLTPVMAKIAQILLNPVSGKNMAVKTKYQSSKVMKVSHMNELNSKMMHEISRWSLYPVFQDQQ